MSSVKKHPNFQHRHCAESVHGVPGMDQTISFNKICVLLGVLRDYLGTSVVKPADGLYLSTIVNLINDEVLDCEARLDFQQKQKTSSLN